MAGVIIFHTFEAEWQAEINVGKYTEKPKIIHTQP